VKAPSRRSFLFAAGAGAVALAGVRAFLWEPRRLTITRHRLGTGDRTIRVAQLTDLHIQRLGDYEADVARETMALAPDVIVITGDAIDNGERIAVLDEFLALLDPATPKYAIMGNWDHWAGVTAAQLRAVYERHGCRLLVNQSVIHAHNGLAVRLTGVDDLVSGVPSLDHVTPGDGEVAHILLAHCPAYREYAERAAPGRFTAMLSGHTHGGQVRVLGIAPILPRGSGGYVSGWYREADRLPLYVSRGIGTSGIHARFFAPPEVALFEIG
jgi:predicted MPP superfamily phosphohydrolase